MAKLDYYCCCMDSVVAVEFDDVEFDDVALFDDENDEDVEDDAETADDRMVVEL